MRCGPAGARLWRAWTCTHTPTHPRTPERGKVPRTEGTRRPAPRPGADIRDTVSYQGPLLTTTHGDLPDASRPDLNWSAIRDRPVELIHLGVGDGNATVGP